MRAEGGATDPSVVVQDCLKICSNILCDSETCQRLFYGMGDSWHLQLVSYFDPEILENNELNRIQRGNYEQDDENSANVTSWYHNSIRLSCAVVAMTALSDSQKLPTEKHQILVGVDSVHVVQASAFWIARLGPMELLIPALTFLENLARDNSRVSSNLSHTTIKVSSPIKGKHVPDGVETVMTFGWKPLPSDDRRFIAIPTLLADRYVFSATGWCADSTEGNKQVPNETSTTASEDLDQSCLRVLDVLLAADSTNSGLIMQHILAPPPPALEEELSGALETMRPFGVVLLNTLVEMCTRVLGGISGGVTAFPRSSDVEVAERSANLLTLVFVHGGKLARELSTALSTGHTSLGAGRGGPVATALPHQPLLPFLLATAGRAARVQGGGYKLMSALLRMLAAAATDCEVAVRQVTFLYIFIVKKIVIM